MVSRFFLFIYGNSTLYYLQQRSLTVRDCTDFRRSVKVVMMLFQVTLVEVVLERVRFKISSSSN